MASTSGRPLGATGLKAYSASELRQATGNFHDGMFCIGQGGFGKVYRAMVGLHPVAVKVLDREGMQGLKEFHNEVKLLSSMRHPHVVRLLGYASEGSTQCLVYELMSGGNLEEALELSRNRTHSLPKGGAGPAAGALPWQQRVRIAAQMAQAIEYLHSRGVIHRDIKPANIFLDCDHNAKLGDIGLAADGVYAGAAIAHDGDQAVGTWSYLAPEYKAQGRSSVRTDVYALGLTLLQLLTSAAHPRDLVRRFQQALEDCTLLQLVDPTGGAWDPRIVERCAKLSLWCCMHDPDQRPPASAISTELRRISGLLEDKHGAELGWVC